MAFRLWVSSLGVRYGIVVGMAARLGLARNAIQSTHTWILCCDSLRRVRFLTWQPGPPEGQLQEA